MSQIFCYFHELSYFLITSTLKWLRIESAIRDINQIRTWQKEKRFGFDAHMIHTLRCKY